MNYGTGRNYARSDKNLGTRVFRTYQQKDTVNLNNTISANSVEEYWELDKVESIRKSCCHEEATP
jgi:hypothetical protein